MNTSPAGSLSILLLLSACAKQPPAAVTEPPRVPAPCETTGTWTADAASQGPGIPVTYQCVERLFDASGCLALPAPRLDATLACHPEVTPPCTETPDMVRKGAGVQPESSLAVRDFPTLVGPGEHPDENVAAALLGHVRSQMALVAKASSELDLVQLAEGTCPSLEAESLKACEVANAKLKTALLAADDAFWAEQQAPDCPASSTHLP
jgi:hypothetical protein